MKTTFTAIAIVFAVALLAAPMTNADPKGVEWKSISDALENAPKENRKIVLDVYTDWCGWCKRMDRDTYDNEEVAKYLGEKYIASKMNPEKEGKVSYDGKELSQAQFSQGMGINGYPATAFFNEKGELLTVVSGYIKAEEFLRILKYFGDDHYLTTKWEDYAKQGEPSQEK